MQGLPPTLEPEVLDVLTDPRSLQLVATCLEACTRSAREGAVRAIETYVPPPPPPPDAAQAACQVCLSTGRAEKLLLCDGCHVAIHVDCLSPPIAEVPEGDWYCADCFDTAAKGLMALGDATRCVQYICKHAQLYKTLATLPQYDEIARFLLHALVALAPRSPGMASSVLLRVLHAEPWHVRAHVADAAGAMLLQTVHGAAREGA